MRVTRVGIALTAVIAAGLMPAAGVLLQTARSPELLRPRDDPISAFDRHLAPLREALRGEPMVGYLAPSTVPKRTTHLYTVRYALAPVQVIDDSHLPLVVAEGVSDARLLPPHLRVRRDFGRGLLLLERVR